jgi:hypothetical protein
MCFVWISEQTAIISVYNINWLVCITETECVYCAVRTECIHTVQVNLSLWLCHPQTVTRRSLTAKAPVRSQVSESEICSGQSGNGKDFPLRTTVLSPLSILCQWSTLTFIHISRYQKDKRAKPGYLPKRNNLSEIGEHWIEKYFDLL